MKVAYLVLAHKELKQVINLINVISSTKDTHCFVHVDKSSSFPKLIETYDSINSTWFSELKTPWASFDTVRAELFLMTKALEWKADRVVMLSGQDYPIKSNDYILRYLQTHKNTGFIEGARMPVANWGEHQGGLYRVNRIHFLLAKKWRAFPLHTKKKPLSFIFNIMAYVLHQLFLKTSFINNYYVGSHWWSITNQQVEFVLDKSQDARVVRAFKFSKNADESFVHSILYNAPKGMFNLQKQSIHFIKGLDNSAHPDILVEDDFLEIKKAPFLFARKLDALKSNKLKQLIDSELLKI